MVKAITRYLQAWSIRAPMAPLNKKLLRDLWRLKGQGLATAAVLCGAMVCRRVYRLDLVTALKTRE